MTAEPVKVDALSYQLSHTPKQRRGVLLGAININPSVSFDVLFAGRTMFHSMLYSKSGTEIKSVNAEPDALEAQD